MIFTNGTAAITFGDISMHRIHGGNLLRRNTSQVVRPRPEYTTTRNVKINCILPDPQLLVPAILVSIIRFHISSLHCSTTPSIHHSVMPLTIKFSPLPRQSFPSPLPSPP